MKIGIDARLYGTGHGGIGRYTEKLIEYLEKVDQDNQYVVFIQKSNFDEYQPQNPNFKKVLADFRVYSFGEQVVFPKLIKKHQLDFIHFAHFNVPLFYRGKFIVTIHDLIISHYPGSRTTTLNPLIYKIKLFLYNITVSRAAKRAEKIIAVTKFTKDDIIRLLKVPAGKIKVVYEGVTKIVIASEAKQSRRDRRGLRPRDDTSGDYLLYVGSAYPHKNLEKLLVAFQEIVKEQPNLKLIMVGKKNYFYERLENEIKNLGLEKNVMLAGYANDEKLAEFYANARLYVFPSLLEGFGLPPLEAQAHGLPVASSDKSCLPEVLGDSAIYFDPNDVDDMATKIRQGLNDEALRQDLIKKGFENIKKYSWESCARETLEEYKVLHPVEEGLKP